MTVSTWAISKKIPYRVKVVGPGLVALSQNYGHFLRVENDRFDLGYFKKPSTCPEIPVWYLCPERTLGNPLRISLRVSRQVEVFRDKDTR